MPDCTLHDGKLAAYVRMSDGWARDVDVVIRRAKARQEARDEARPVAGREGPRRRRAEGTEGCGRGWREEVTAAGGPGGSDASGRQCVVLGLLRRRELR